MALQDADEARLVADNKVKPDELVGQVRITFPGMGVILSCGGACTARLNNVPLPHLPPLHAVPYKVFPDKSNPAVGFAPSILVEKMPPIAVKS